MRRLLIVALVLLGFSCTAAFAATLGVGSWHLWAGSQTLAKGTCTLTGSTPTLDTFVNESNTSQANGNAATMQVLGFTGSRRYAYVRFDLSSCNIPSTGGADSATLSLRITTAPSSNRTINVTPVTSTWNESLTWTLSQQLSLASSPTTSFATGTTNNVTKTVTVTADVDDQIKTGSVFGWRLSDAGSSLSTTTFGSSENGTVANRPVLTINYEK